MQAQTYPFVEHLVVADGPDYHDRVRSLLPTAPRHPIFYLPLPFNTGSEAFCGHRVYGGAPYLCNGLFVSFLDEDNWFEPEHLTSLMAKATARGLQSAQCTAQIVDTDGRFVTDDDCESLGRWPVWYNPQAHLVDVNCYMLRKDVAIATSPLWYRRYRVDENPDYAICRQLLKYFPNCDTNGRHTVNYRVGMTRHSVNADWFLRGNAEMRSRVGEELPWRSSQPGVVTEPAPASDQPGPARTRNTFPARVPGGR